MISPRLSVYLDLLRAIAAFIVLLSHFAYPRFTGGDYLVIRDLNLGSDAVVVFFVLSGFVIAHTSRVKDLNLKAYLFSRATRIYSVAIPAVLVAFLFDRFGASVSPESYQGWWYHPTNLGQTLFYGLTFSGEWSQIGFRLGTNGPYWSLSYEVAYYLLFGMAFYLSGMQRVVLLVLTTLIFGIKILALAPVWLLGMLAYRALAVENKMSRISLWLMAIIPVAIYVSCLGLGTPAQLMGLSINLFGAESIAGLRFSNEFLWNGLIGVLICCHLYAVGRLSCSDSATVPAARAIKWFAGASFSLYLVHYPALQMLHALLPQDVSPLFRHGLLLCGAVAISLIFAQLFERTLGSFRKAILAICEFAKPREVLARKL
jgi:peptidoglycan/LPS O-acetylase OafA/YrhL